MRVLQINTTVNSGSTGRIAEDIGKVLLANGHESYIAYGRGNQKSMSQLLKIGSKIDLYLHIAITRFFDKHGFGSKLATKRLLKQIDKIKPDAVGLHNVHGYYVNIETLFSYLASKSIPVIWTFHDCWPFTGHCAYFDSIGCEKWKTQCNNCPKTKSYPASFGYDNSINNYIDKKRIFNQVSNLTIVTPSNWLRNLVSQSFLQQKSLTIHNGVDLNQFKERDDTQVIIRKWNLNGKKVILGVASIWDARKGLADFKYLASKLQNNFQIILIGLTAQQIAKLPQNIIGVQRTESLEELARYYSLATVFVNPTYEDNFPTTNIESLSCGTPVITYNTGGSPESVSESTGKVVKKGDKDALLDAIIEIISKNNFREMAKDCRNSAVAFFNKDDRYLEYLKLYEEMVKMN